ncbi:hypothetical protein ACNKHS_06450 [Shigella flexneri]
MDAAIQRPQPDQYNGACLLGLRGIVIKSHGAANQRALTVAIEQAVRRAVQSSEDSRSLAWICGNQLKVTERTCIRRF